MHGTLLYGTMGVPVACHGCLMTGYTVRLSRGESVSCFGWDMGKRCRLLKRSEEGISFAVQTSRFSQKIIPIASLGDQLWQSPVRPVLVCVHMLHFRLELVHVCSLFSLIWNFAVYIVYTNASTVDL